MPKQFLNGAPVVEVDRQPTLPVETQAAKIEEQPTEALPIESQREQLEEQSTLVLPVEPRLSQIAEQATLALPLRRSFSEQQIAIPASLRPSKFKRRWLIFALLYLVLIGGGLIGRVAVVNWM